MLRWVLFLCVVYQTQILCMDANPLSLRGRLKGHQPREWQGLDSQQAQALATLNARLAQAKWELRKLDEEHEGMLNQGVTAEFLDYIGWDQHYSRQRSAILAKYQCTEKDIRIDTPCPSSAGDELYQKLMKNHQTK